MREIVRSDVNEEWAHSGVVEAGDFVFISYCVGNIGQPIENQINGAFDHLARRLVLAKNIGTKGILVRTGVGEGSLTGSL